MPKKDCHKRSLTRNFLTTSCLTAAVFCAAVPSARANPLGGVVSAGQADITEIGKTLEVYQHSQKTVIDWRGFDIAPDETTRFYQPSSSAIALNRVNSNSPSRIEGALSANGNVIIVNQNGVMFGKSAVVDVNGLVATTADIDNDNFMNQRELVFDKTGKPDAAIINEGLITAKEAGLVGLVAPNVANSGIIMAKLGKVQLASGDTVAVDMYGDGLMNIAVSDEVKSQIVGNSGVIQADGGTIRLTAAAGKNIINSLIANSGALQARSVGKKNGEIVISAAGSNKTNKPGSSGVAVSGILDASGRNAGESGGKITVTGDHVALLNGTLIDATGSDGASGTTEGKAISAHRDGAAGGNIMIGGDYLGQGDTPTAKNLYVDAGALILNDSLRSGDAGRTIFWSDDTTDFYGNVYARALGDLSPASGSWDAQTGGNSGNGGFVETSGHKQLNAGGYVNLTASNGNRGTYFLDPTNITIYGNFDPTFKSTDNSIDLGSSLELWLDASAITGLQNGDSVTSWSDLSGNNNHAITMGSSPIYITSGPNGKPALRFANGQYLTTTNNIGISGAMARSVNVLFSQSLSINTNIVGWGADGAGMTNDLMSYSNSLIGHFYGGGYDTIAGSPSFSQNTLTSAYMTYDGTKTSMYKDGVYANQVTMALNTTDSKMSVGKGQYSGYNGAFNGDISEVAIFSSNLTADARALFNQYQTAKWGAGITPPGTGATEVAKATASDGYSSFTTRYLEYLSQSADISLQASNDITFDLKGDVFTLAANRNLTLTAGNDIKTTAGSTGTITTSRLTSGGNITMTANSDIDLSNIALNSGGGDITLSAVSDTILNSINTSGGDVDVTSNNLTILGGGLANSNSLRGYWRFDEATGTAVYDSSGYNNTGALMNGALRSTNLPSGFSGGSIHLDGVDDHVLVNDSNSLDLTNGFTFSLWMKADSAQGNRYLLGKLNNSSTDNAYALAYGYAADQVQFYASGNAYGYPSGNSNMTVNDTSWHHISYTYDGANFNKYMDGALMGSVAMTSNLAASTGNLLIGSFNGAGHNFRGQMDDLRIYNAALSGNEVASLAHAPVTWNTGDTTFNVGNNLSFDLKGDTLNMISGSSFTATVGNTIQGATTGTISTNNADISLSGATLDLSNLTLNAAGTGIVRLNGTSDVTISASNIAANNSNIIINSGRDILSGGNYTLRSSGTGNIILSAGRDIIFNNKLDIDASGSGFVKLVAARDITLNGGGDINAVGSPGTELEFAL